MFKATDSALRLFWTLQGDLTTAILVMRDDFEPLPRSDLEPYHQPQLEPVWHSLSQELMVTPLVSSLAVSVDILQDWEREWADAHRGHCDLVNQSRRLVPLAIAEIAADKVADDYNDNDTPLKLIRCCNQTRPTEFEPLLVHASTDRGVTVHDYLTSVHPWLMSKRDNLVAALDVWDVGITADTPLMVTCMAPNSLIIDEERHWRPIRPRGPTQKSLGVRSTTQISQPPVLTTGDMTRFLAELSVPP